MGDEVKVVLKPVLGIKPELYLVVLYAFMAVLVFFALLFLPGLVKNGSYYRIYTNSGPAVVEVDGVILGSSEDVLFMPQGERHIKISRPGFRPYIDNIEVKGKFFFSLFVPRREVLAIVLEKSQIDDEFINSAAMQSATWSYIEVTAKRQQPPVIEELALDIGSVPPQPFLSLIHSDQQLRDFIRGSVRMRPANGDGASPLTAASVTTALARFLPAASHDSDKTKNLGGVIVPIINRDLLNSLLSPYAHLQDVGQFDDSYYGESSTLGSSQLRELNNSLSRISRGYNFILLNNHAAVLDSQVSLELFQQFLDEQDSNAVAWKYDPQGDLEKIGLTTANLFLSTAQKDRLIVGNEVVRGISLLAVNDFCNWLMAKPGFENYKIRPPHLGEIKLLYENSNADDSLSDGFWEMSDEYVGIGQKSISALSYSLARTQSIPSDSLDGLRQNLASENTLSYENYLIQSAPVGVVFDTGEIGTLTPSIVSPLLTFRLVAEVK